MLQAKTIFHLWQLARFSRIHPKARARRLASHLIADEQEYINFTIVHASDQPLDEGPTVAALDLVPLMPYGEYDSACILPSALHLVKTCSHYAFQVQLPRGADREPVVMPCSKVLSVIKSTKASTPDPLGAGFKLVTRDVEDMLADASQPQISTAPQTFVLSSYLHARELACLLVGSPRGKPRLRA